MKNLFFLLFVLFIAACHPFDVPQEGLISTEEKTLDQLSVPSSFVFNTHKEVKLTLSVKGNDGQLMTNIPFDVFIKKQNSTDSVFLFSGQTNTEGVYQTNLGLDADVETIIATTSYIGVPSYQTTTITSNNVSLVFGEENDINKPRNFVEQRPESTELLTRGSGNFVYMGSYDANGVPRYLMAKSDIVNQSILNTINASVPEGSPLTKSHPEYLTNGINHNLSLKEKAEVWVTFVFEGAGYRNSLGYYTYPTNSPPTSASDIAKLNVIFPNASFQGSGGGLKTGDKVSLGTFAAGTTIAWFVVPDGWDSRSQKVTDKNTSIHYSDKKLNTFTTEAHRQHSVSLLDREHQLVLIGFEDLDRPGGDNDFNDAVFYATVSSFAAIETTNVAQVTNVEKDTDGDGVSDTKDVEPNNPLVAYYAYAPALNQTNTLAFEDLWPTQGDYDMNDVVVDYNIHEKLNAATKITQIKFNLTVRALGGGFRNGFGFELPVSPSKIASIEGAKIKDTYIKLNANGTEAGQNNAVIIAFDNGYSLMTTPGGGFVNTEKSKPVVADYKFEITVTLNTPLSRSELGNAPYNPFIIANRERGREVHLAGYKPTTLANKALFSTEDDNTGGSKYYQTKNNLPWAIHISTGFKYPSEKIPVNQAYLKFNNWAESGGTTFTDWFNNKTNYTNPTKIY